jgi:circadian clock protein KaiC
MLDRSRGLGMSIQQGVGPGKIHIRQVDPAEISPGEFAAMVQTSTQVHQARVVVIDSLNGYLHAMPDNQSLTAQLHELLAYLNNCGVTTFMVVAQSGLMGPSMKSPVDASYLADTVVMLRMYEHEGKVRKAISAIKKRSGQHEEAIRRMWFDSAGVHLSEPLSHLRGVLSGIPVELGGVSAVRSADHAIQTP